MKRSICVAVIVALALGSAGPGQSLAQSPAPPACLHGADEAPEQVTRRNRALQFTRHINTIQASAGSTNGTYLPPDRLVITEALPSGFALKLSASGRAYAFS